MWKKRREEKGRERESEIGRQIEREVKTERGRQKSNREEDLVKRYYKGNMHVRDRERKREREGGKRGQVQTWNSHREFLFFKEGWREI